MRHHVHGRRAGEAGIVMLEIGELAVFADELVRIERCGAELVLELRVKRDDLAFWLPLRGEVLLRWPPFDDVAAGVPARLSGLTYSQTRALLRFELTSFALDSQEAPVSRR